MNEREKLVFLLGHWKEHDHTHRQTYREWALKADDLGEAEVSHLLREVSDLSDQIEKKLDKARQLL